MRLQLGKTIIVFIWATVLLGCHVTAQNKYNTSNQIDTSLFSNKVLFPDYTFKSIDSLAGFILPGADTTDYSSMFKNNIAVIYFYENDSLIKYQNDLKSSNCLPAVVEARFYDDTLRVNTGIGFFAASGVVINISGNDFKAFYYANADNDSVFKYQQNDEAYMSDITVKAVQENLILDKKPTFVNEEGLVGQYEGTFEPFFEQEYNADKIRKMRVKVIFKCVVRNVDEAFQQFKKENKE